MHSQRSRNGEVDDDTGDVDDRRHQGRRRSRGIQSDRAQAERQHRSPRCAPDDDAVEAPWRERCLAASQDRR
jgi:hypothetical protein